MDHLDITILEKRIRTVEKFLLFLLVYFVPRLNAQNITSVAGIGTAGYSGDGGPAISAKLDEPHAVYADRKGNIYVGDINNNRVRMVNAAGIISTVAGSASSGFSGDSGLATAAAITQPKGIVADTFGNFWFTTGADCKVRSVNTSGIVNTVVGKCLKPSPGDGGAADSACLKFPGGIARDAIGNIYIADVTNHRIRKVSTLGIISTIAGTGTAGYNGEGILAISAQLKNPQDVALGGYGNIYIADQSNSRVRKVDQNGIISTVTGNGTLGFSGDFGIATNAQLWGPMGIVFDAYNNMYISDMGNNRIRKVNNSGIISTIAGTGTGGYNGDGILAISAQLNSPVDQSLDTLGNLYIADFSNHRIRKIDNVVGITQLGGKMFSVMLSPNPSSGRVTLVSDVQIQEYRIYNSMGLLVSQGCSGFTREELDLTEQPAGIYFVQIKTSGGSLTKRIVVQY